MPCCRRMPVVLIVDDEPLIRMDAAKMIEAAGFEVIEAANADEAIMHCSKKYPDRFTRRLWASSVTGWVFAG